MCVGGVAEQPLPHWSVVPVLHSPYSLQAWQEDAPGTEGAEALQEPSGWIVPEFDWPQAFVAEQALPVLGAHTTHSSKRTFGIWERLPALETDCHSLAALVGTKRPTPLLLLTILQSE